MNGIIAIKILLIISFKGFHMRLFVPCMKCFQEDVNPLGGFSRVEFTDDGFYDITCENGHSTLTILQQHKFEVLFEVGANAIVDGYYREAVSSFTSSLERFYEFCIRVILEASTSNDALFQCCWKKVSSQSERQLGAFIFMWASCFNETPSMLSPKLVTFRNEVIHKGKIPTKIEAVEYGNAVIDTINPKIKLLQEKFPAEISNSIFRQIKERTEKSGNAESPATMCISTVLSLSNTEPSHYTKKLEEHLKSVEQQRQLFSWMR